MAALIVFEMYSFILFELFLLFKILGNEIIAATFY